jgi:DNA-directed RNA polymerase sigma subunit (sigma70/sigma32)
VIRAIRRLVAEQARPVVLSDRALRNLGRLREAEPVGRRGDQLVDPGAETAYERLLDEIDAEDLLRLLAALSRRERAVLRARRGLPRAERGFAQIGEPLGLGAARVSQIERRARGKLAAQRAPERG